MKTTRSTRCLGFVSCFIGLLGVGGGFCTSQAASAWAPVIRSIHLERSNVVVRVEVPPGLRRVTLEAREHLGRRAWEPVAVARLDGAGGAVTFRLARSRSLEFLRVRGDATEPLPAAFYAGTNAFGGDVVSTSDGTQPHPTLYRSNTTTDDLTAGLENGPREVVESDIWKFRDRTLYFFNQYRGLQVIDLTHPDAARVRGTLALAAAGEQMYLLGSNHVVLLAREGCNYEQSQVLVVADRPAGPEVVARVPVSGSVTESRLVGHALYVAAATYRTVTNAGTVSWEAGTVVTALDLANPAAPVVRGTLWYAGYGHTVAATDALFFVVTQNKTNAWQSDVRMIDITAPDGTMTPYGKITTAGYVQDKFKLHYRDSILTTIAEDRRSTPTARVTTRLETFRVPDPRSMGPGGMVKLGSLELGRGESLHATRFDGDRVYIVTFFQIDPLWVVSLADPARPAIVGSVEVPGWSTYIEPLGDRLVTVGVETGRVAVSLFNVSNPARPTLTSRVLLGQTYSWTEANYDEKAFTVLPQANLVLVPFNGDFTNRYGSAVQLIDLQPDALVARGQITGAFQFRRATTYADRILSLSGWELLSVDATDRDAPVVRHRLELAWTVDRVFLSGPYLLAVQNGATWDDAGGPTVRVTLAETPEVLLGQLRLTNLPVLGATVQGQHLYLVQGQGGDFYPLPVLADASTSAPPPNFVLTVVNLSELPALSVAGQCPTYLPSLGWGGAWQAVWPRPNLLVWAGGGHGYWWWRGPAEVVPMGVAAAQARLIWPWPYWGSRGGHLLAYDVSNPAAPVLASEVNLGTNNWWNFSQAFAADGLVYLSHQMAEPVEVMPRPEPDAVPPAIGVIAVEPITPVRSWMQRSFLDVVDYADPTDPLVRRPVNIPGTLVGVSPDGQLIYTTGPRWIAGTITDGVEYLDASAYLGSEVRWVDSLPLSAQWPHPVHVVGPNVLVGRPAETATSNTGSAPLVENWTLSSTGRFVRLSSAPLSAPASALATFGTLLAVQETDNAVELFALGDAAGLERLGRGQPAGCWWFDLRQGDGDVARGLWLPLGAYGVGRVPVQ